MRHRALRHHLRQIQIIIYFISSHHVLFLSLLNHADYGNIGTRSSPSLSGSPNIRFMSRDKMIGSALYLVGVEADTGEYVKNSCSCSMCKRQIINAGIRPRGAPTYPVEITSSFLTITAP